MGRISLLSEKKVSEDIISGDDVNKQVCKRGDSELPKKMTKKLNSIISFKVSKPTNLLQISYFTEKKLAFNKGGGELIPWSRGSIAVEHLNASPGSGETPVRMN
jgi:hypothetical protein